MMNKNNLSNKRKNKHTLIRKVTLAACFCFITIVGVLFAININKSTHDIETHYYIGDTQTNNIGTVTFDGFDSEKHICTFTLVKKDNTQIYFRLGGYTSDELTDNKGNRYQKHQEYDVITPYNYYIPDWGHKVLKANLIITVNGNVVDNIPREPGEYEISIDFSDMYNHLDKVHNRIYISNFGKFKFQYFESIHPNITRIPN